MRQLKMLSQAVKPVAKPIWIESVVTIAADQVGMFYPQVESRRARHEGR